MENNKNYWSCLCKAWWKGQPWLMLPEWFAENDFFNKLCHNGGKLSKATMRVFWCAHESELFNEEMELLSLRPCSGFPRGHSTSLQERNSRAAPSKESLFLRSPCATPDNAGMLNFRLSGGVDMWYMGVDCDTWNLKVKGSLNVSMLVLL